MSNVINKLTGWGSLAVMIFAAAPVMAQVESSSGLIRITDKSMGNAPQAHIAPVSMTKPDSHCQSCQQGNCQTGNCQTGNCPTGNCPSCEYSTGYCPSCYGRGCRLGGLCHHCTRSPGSGYIVPGKIPIKREPIGYTQWYPSYWSGMGYGTPVPFNPAVAVPTDTTQLGYYYNHVPTWMPKPNMIPGIPNPEQWHIRRCNNNGGCPQGCPQNGFNGQGYVVNSEIVQDGSNLKPVPEHINAPNPQADHGQQMQAPQTQKLAPQQKVAEPTAFFPMPEPEVIPTSAISFPQLESDVDNEE